MRERIAVLQAQLDTFEVHSEVGAGTVLTRDVELVPARAKHYLPSRLLAMQN